MARYQMNMMLEVVTDNDETVKAIHIHKIENEATPVALWCDFLDRLRRMMPDNSVLFVGGSMATPKSPVEKDKGYVITDYYGGYIPGDFFKGISDYELEHCRSGEVFKVNRKIMGRLFRCCGDFDPQWTAPISPETLEMISKAKEEKDK